MRNPFYPTYYYKKILKISKTVLPMRNKFWCMGMAIFLMTFFFYLFHTQNLPFDVSADGVLWLHRGYEKSWSSIAKQIFLERGDYINERNSFENRPVHVLVFKVILSLFGFDLNNLLNKQSKSPYYLYAIEEL